MAIAGEFGLDLTPEGRAALSMLDELEDIVVEVGYQADQMAIDGETWQRLPIGITMGLCIRMAP